MKRLIIVYNLARILFLYFLRSKINNSSVIERLNHVTLEHCSNYTELYLIETIILSMALPEAVTIKELNLSLWFTHTHAHTCFSYSTRIFRYHYLKHNSGNARRREQREFRRLRGALLYI